MLVMGLGALIYALTVGREAGWPFWSVLAAMAGTLLLLIFFGHQRLRIRRNQEPLMDVRIFGHRQFLIGLVALLFHFMLHTAYLLMIAVYLQSGMGISALACGVYFVPHALLFMLSSFVASKLLARFGKNVLLAGLGTIMMSFILHILLMDYKTEASVVISLIGLYGLGNGLVLPFLLNVVLDKVPVSEAGIASGIFSTFQQIASALGIGIIGGVFYQTLTDASADYKLALDHGLFVGLSFAIVVAGMLVLTQSGESRQPAGVTNS